MMEDLRLRARLLEALITRGNIVPRSSYRIRDPDALPDTLQQVMFTAAQEGSHLDVLGASHSQLARYLWDAGSAFARAQSGSVTREGLRRKRQLDGSGNLGS